MIALKLCFKLGIKKIKTVLEAFNIYIKAVLTCSAQRVQNVFIHLQIRFLTKNYKIGRPGY